MLILERINPFGIVVSHFETFYDHSKDRKPCYFERFVHIVVPFLLSGTAVYLLGAVATKDLCSSLLNGFAILGGFLINAAFVITAKKETLEAGTPSPTYHTLLSETFDNTLFEILLCFVVVVLCAIFPMLGKGDVEVVRAMSCVIFGFSIMFMVTLLMILKRLNKIFQ